MLPVKISSFSFYSRLLPLILVLTATVSFFSCAKNTPEQANETIPEGTVLARGTFQTNSHTTSGMVSLVQDSSGKKKLVFQNFKTDNGPDLRVWLSPNTGASSYVEAGILKAVNGNFFYEMPSSFNHSTNNHVLIWCEDFSVLFGHAVLQ